MPAAALLAGVFLAGCGLLEAGADGPGGVELASIAGSQPGMTLWNDLERSKCPEGRCLLTVKAPPDGAAFLALEVTALAANNNPSSGAVCSEPPSDAFYAATCQNAYGSPIRGLTLCLPGDEGEPWHWGPCAFSNAEWVDPQYLPTLWMLPPAVHALVGDASASQTPVVLEPSSPKPLPVVQGPGWPNGGPIMVCVAMEPRKTIGSFAVQLRFAGGRTAGGSIQPVLGDANDPTKNPSCITTDVPAGVTTVGVRVTGMTPAAAGGKQAVVCTNAYGGPGGSPVAQCDDGATMTERSVAFGTPAEVKPLAEDWSQYIKQALSK